MADEAAAIAGCPELLSEGDPNTDHGKVQYHTLTDVFQLAPPSVV
ncbi:hypothetical protein ACF08N_37500 [Streptomyces sp. NPDC015127]